MRRPGTIVFVAISLCLAAGIAVAVGTALLLPGTFLDRMWQYNRPAYAAFLALGRAFGGVFLALGILISFTAGGLLRGRRWAWVTAVGIFAMNGLGDVVGLVTTRDLVRSGSGMLFAAIYLVLLLRPDVRDYCGRKA